MADNAADQPTEEEVKAHNAAEEAKWQDDFKEEDLIIPLKPEDKPEKKEDDAAEGDVEDKGEAADDAEKPVVEEPNIEPTPVVTVADPGEYKAADYSFKVTDKAGKSITIHTPEDADAFAEDDENFKTAADLKNFLRQSQKMENNLERDHDKWETQKETFQQQSAVEQERRDNIDNVAAEFDYLVAKNKLPAVAAEFANANWSDPQVAKQPGVKEQIALLNYMNQENLIRKKAGIKPFGPVDALTAMQSDDAEKAKEEDKKAAGEARKTAGAKVAGVSPTQTGAYVPKGISVGNPNVFKRNQAVWDN